MKIYPIIFSIFFSFFLVPAILFAKSDENDWAKNVQRNGNTVIIKNIPQIDSRGGVCGRGPVSMILRYFEPNLDQNRLARHSDAELYQGTYFERRLRWFSKRKLFNDFEIEQIYSLYNDEAEKENLIEAYLRGKHRGKNLSQQEISKIRRDGLSQLNPSIARETLLVSRKNVARLLENRVKNLINKGVPVIWGVLTNFAPKYDEKSTNMRLLVGYTLSKNRKIENFLYYDSWFGKVVEQAVKFDDAALMTSSLYVILPIQKTTQKSNDPTVAILPQNIQLQLVKIPASENKPEFYIGKYEVTQQQFRVLMRTNPAKNKGDSFPVERVTFEEANKFCSILTEVERKNGRILRNEHYSLPTYEQWLRVAACGEELLGEKRIPSLEQLKRQENLRLVYNQRAEMMPVGSKFANEFGVFDILGNVSEWLSNGRIAGVSFVNLVRSYDDSSYLALFNPSYYQRSASINSPKFRDFKSEYVGFRVVKNISGVQEVPVSEPKGVPAEKPILNESLKSKLARIRMPFSTKKSLLKNVLEDICDFSKACDERGLGVEIILEDPKNEFIQKHITIDRETVALKILLEEIFRQANAACFERDGKLIVVPAKTVEGVPANDRESVPEEKTVPEEASYDEFVELYLRRIKIRKPVTWSGKIDRTFTSFLKGVSMSFDKERVGLEFVLEDPKGKFSKEKIFYSADSGTLKDFLDAILKRADAKYFIQDGKVVIAPNE